jgi:hypothetical protein
VHADVEEKRKEDFAAKLEKKVGEGGLLNPEAFVEVACDYANG